MPAGGGDRGWLSFCRKLLAGCTMTNKEIKIRSIENIQESSYRRSKNYIGG